MFSGSAYARAIVGSLLRIGTSEDVQIAGSGVLGIRHASRQRSVKCCWSIAAWACGLAVFP